MIKCHPETYDTPTVTVQCNSQRDTMNYLPYQFAYAHKCIAALLELADEYRGGNEGCPFTGMHVPDELLALAHKLNKGLQSEFEKIAKPIGRDVRVLNKKD